MVGCRIGPPTSAHEAGNTMIVSDAGLLPREIHRRLADAA
jgi:hypothetical protein